MGQHCSCLQHPPKYQRRQSDDVETMDMERGDNDDGELELEVLDAQETHELLGTRVRLQSGGWTSQLGLLKRSGSTVTVAGPGREEDREENDSDGLKMERGPSLGLVNNNNHLTPLIEPEELSRLLRLYQEATGIVRHYVFRDYSSTNSCAFFQVDKGKLELECVMCLDTFSDDNSKVRTLCNCGMNRTNFHMSCLLEWLNRNVNCPVCREYLFFEDS
ncbi:hypothetical protein PsorP6_004259 [Peronosclerospora sorghi]|uniref:Uncharacterized protein n=1 Tax=Peronosclerospora sorghi TaxID=230839 RepID=A0ACC0VPV5_9STRA|nr:hypothetical protein PsorP6_004259 [Peronosclerospora sorghi]